MSIDCAGAAAIFASILSVGAATMLVGCATTKEAADRDAATAARPISSLESALAADNGLEVRRLLFRDERDATPVALGRFGTEAIEDEYLRERLLRNGLRLRLLHDSETESVVAALGAPLRDARVWYGQAVQWRELSRRNVGPGLATVVDGRARSFSSGALRLLSRAWTLPMEDGLRLTIELVPHFDPVGSGGFRAMLGHDSMRGERFDALMVELHLRPGDALLLTADAPGRLWDAPTAQLDDRDARVGGDGDSRTSAGARPESDHGAGDARRAERSGVESGSMAGPGPTDTGMGPPGTAPPTLGELLLSGERPSVRTVLLFLPKLPESGSWGKSGIVDARRTDSGVGAGNGSGGSAR